MKMKATVTTSTGRKVELSINADFSSVEANIGRIPNAPEEVKFAIDQTKTGFQSRFLVREVGNKRLEVILSGNDLAAAQALFAAVSEASRLRAEDFAAYEAHRQGVLAMLNQ